MHCERPTARSWFLTALVLLGGRTIAFAAEGETPAPAPDQRRALRASELTSDFELSGYMDGQRWWALTDSIDNLVMIEPDEGGEPTGRTIVRVLADKSEIVIGARCYDDEPQNIVSFSKAQDSVLDEEDHLVVVIDTYMDGRSGYVFAVNPTGARYDGLVTSQGEEVNIDWDAIWDARTTRDASGWSAEIRIPIKSLGFKKDLDTWGFNVQRRVQRLQETSRWSGANLDYQVFQTSQAGVLTNLPRFDLGVGMSIRPAFVSRGRTPGPGQKTTIDSEFSLDLTQKLGSNLLSALTVNTDFAETEVDVRQLNLTRFPVFFPEKRTFFLEGSDIFQFGLGLDEENLLPFSSRRIGLIGLTEDDQVEVPINVGGKVNGRVGNTNLGALVVNTRKQNDLPVEDFVTVDVPQTTMGAMRVSQNVLDESSVGVLATFGDQLDRSDSWSAGVDMTLQTSSFRGDKNLLFGTWGMLNDRQDLNGDKSSWGVRAEYPNDLLDVNLTSIRIGDGFSPSLGFVPRNNVHIWDFGMEFSPRSTWPWLRQMFYEASFTIFNKRDNSRWESYGATFKPLDWLLESGDRFDIGVSPEGDRPPGAFEISADVDVPAGSYEWTRWFAGARAGEKRRLSGELRFETGSYYNGDLNTVLGRVTLKPSALYAIEFTGERNDGKVDALPDDFEGEEMVQLVERTFREALYGFRLQINVSPDLQLSSLTQYDTQSRELGTNNKLRWTFSPVGDLFVVYNHNLVRRLDQHWEFTGNEIPVKIQYALRF